MPKTKKEQQNIQARFKRRKARTKHQIVSTQGLPRLSVHRSLRHISAQIIDDTKHVTVVAVSEHELSDADKKKNKTERAQLLGALIGKKAQEKKIEKVVFDRSGYRYHGRVKAFADAAREAGLTF
ncbi:MAG: 50S ribosomal protein L18 [Patescibacteria group bacterium]